MSTTSDFTTDEANRTVMLGEYGNAPTRRVEILLLSRTLKIIQYHSDGMHAYRSEDALEISHGGAVRFFDEQSIVVEIRQSCIAVGLHTV